MQEVERGFHPITVEKFIQQTVARNPDETPAELRKSLRACIQRALAGARCDCGEPIWVIGSVFVGHGCFTCITGEADPSEDYEIDEVLAARRHSLADVGAEASG